jgi:hypothetical protein
MKKTKSGKPYTIISENPKMDTSGMAGKPMELSMYEFKMPTMSLNQMLSKLAQREMKK